MVVFRVQRGHRAGRVLDGVDVVDDRVRSSTSIRQLSWSPSPRRYRYPVRGEIPLPRQVARRCHPPGGCRRDSRGQDPVITSDLSPPVVALHGALAGLVSLILAGPENESFDRMPANVVPWSVAGRPLRSPFQYKVSVAEFRSAVRLQVRGLRNDHPVNVPLVMVTERLVVWHLVNLPESRHGCHRRILEHRQRHLGRRVTTRCCPGGGFGRRADARRSTDKSHPASTTSPPTTPTTKEGRTSPSNPSTRPANGPNGPTGEHHDCPPPHLRGADGHRPPSSFPAIPPPPGEPPSARRERGSTSPRTGGS